MNILSETITLSPEETKTLKDFLNLGQALVNSLTSSQISGAAAALGDMMPLLQSLANPGVFKLINTLAECSDSLADLLQLITAYHKAGTFKTALELVTLLGVVKDALGTPTVAQYAEKANTLLVTGDQLVSELGGFDKIQALTKALQKASQAADQDSSTIGIMGLLKALKEPQIQKGLKILLNLAK